MVVPASAEKFATTAAGAPMVMLVDALVALATVLPVQFANWKPLLGVAVIGTEVPESKKPDAGDTVPPLAGDAEIVSWNCVLKVAV